MSYLGNAPVVQATRTLSEFVATAGQTTFTPPGGYQVGYVDVIVNGSMLQSTDFTATDGSTVVLGVACAANDDVRIYALGTFQVANATPADGSVTTAKLAANAVTAAKLAAGAARTNFGAGAILQVVSAIKTDVWSATSQSFLDITGLSAAITPRDVNSRILVMLDLSLGTETSNASIPRIMRDSTPIYIGDAAGVRPQGLGQAYSGNNASTTRHGGIFVDSPASAASVTYKAQLRSTGLVAQYVNRTNRDTNLADYDARGTSSLTLMEIAG